MMTENDIAIQAELQSLRARVAELETCLRKAHSIIIRAGSPPLDEENWIRQANAFLEGEFGSSPPIGGDKP